MWRSPGGASLDFQEAAGVEDEAMINGVYGNGSDGGGQRAWGTNGEVEEDEMVPVIQGAKIFQIKMIEARIEKKKTY